MFHPQGALLRHSRNGRQEGERKVSFIISILSIMSVCVRFHNVLYRLLYTSVVLEVKAAYKVRSSTRARRNRRTVPLTRYLLLPQAASSSSMASPSTMLAFLRTVLPTINMSAFSPSGRWIGSPTYRTLLAPGPETLNHAINAQAPSIHILARLLQQLQFSSLPTPPGSSAIQSHRSLRSVSPSNLSLVAPRHVRAGCRSSSI